MTDEEITKLFEGSFPGLEGYSDSVKLVLEVLVSVNEPVSLELMAKVLETEPFQLEEPLSALDELVREEEGYVSLYSHECIDWLCDPARSGPYALEDTKHGDIGVVLWEAYEDFENSPHQKEVIDWLAKYVVFTSLWDSNDDNAKELNGLAHFLSGVGKLESSVGLYLRVLHIVEELFGSQDLQVATAQNNQKISIQKDSQTLQSSTNAVSTAQTQLSLLEAQDGVTVANPQAQDFTVPYTAVQIAQKNFDATIIRAPVTGDIASITGVIGGQASTASSSTVGSVSVEVIRS